MPLVDNERIKLTAGFLNGMATAMVVAGAIAPLAAFTYALPGAASASVVAFVGAGWLVGGVTLHFMARRFLRRLRE